MKAAQNVLRHYSVETTQKTMDWISFVGVTTMIYAPRIVAISANHRGHTVRHAPHPQPGPVQDAPPGSPLEQAYAASAVQPEAAE